ncbi:MAG: GNAT family N-acetyltransferase [Thermoanaerobaculia bacterium]
MHAIVSATTPDDVAAVAALFREYAASLGVDLGFQHFEEELAAMPGDYAPPRGRLLLARDLGCVALRPFSADVCEMTRLYVRPAGRGSGLGRLLAERIIEEARTIGYRAMRLDTLPMMATARAMYVSFGFREIAPYRFNPIEGTKYFELEL